MEGYYRQLSLFDTYDQNDSKIKGVVRELSYDEARDFILPRHYAGRMPTISIAFGWFIDGELVAACSFGKPASPFLCDSICGKEYSSCVYELNRLIRIEELKEPLSEFVSYCLRELRSRNWIIVSYADSGMHHHGYIYQACNFLYTGCTKERTDMYGQGGQHARSAKKYYKGIRQIRTVKYRYVYFCTSDKKLKKAWRQALKYPVLPYPKGDNENYVLGTVYKPTLIEKEDTQNGKSI